jgi:hypothetical protein
MKYSTQAKLEPRKPLGDLKKESIALKKLIQDSEIGIQSLRVQLQTMSKELVGMQRNLQEVEAQIAKAERLENPPVVTDHALVRYLERKLGLDLDVLRAEILTDELVKRVNVMGGSCTYKKFVVRDNVIVTVLP